jgi:hypothetical protein
MDLPTEVLIHNATLGLKGTRGTLLAISELGYFEIRCQLGSRIHRILLPVSQTALIVGEAEEELAELTLDVER